MVRNYKRKTTRQSWSEEAMGEAISAVIAKKMGCRKAAATFGVPQTTLERKVLMKKQNPDVNKPLKERLGPKKRIFSDKEEEELVSYLRDMENRLFGLSPSDFRRLAFQLAVRNGIKHSFNVDNATAGKDWLQSFLKRHELSLRKPESTSAARAMGFNKVSVSKFFQLLCGIIDEYKLTADQIFNCDETGISSVAKSKCKIIATKGKKQVGALSSAERGQTVTVEICFNAAGRYMPPMFIFPRQRMKEELMNGAPPGAWAEVHSSGWIQTGLFENWFKKFIKFSQVSKDYRVLLLLDGHTTHTQNLKLIEMARENGVILLCFPPHCTHRLQPLDVAFMKPLSTYYDHEITTWLRAHPGRVVTMFQIAEIFGKAYARAATMPIAMNGFSATGIWPCNSNIFTDADFIAAETTERAHINDAVIPTETIETREIEESQNIPDLTREPTRTPEKQNRRSKPLTTPLNISTQQSISNLPSCSYFHAESPTTPSVGANSSSTSFAIVSPQAVLPVPHVGNDGRKRKSVR